MKYSEFKKLKLKERKKLKPTREQWDSLQKEHTSFQIDLYLQTKKQQKEQQNV